jgi:acyl carrier protein
MSKCATEGQQIPTELSDTTDLLLSGLLDSLGFAELIAAIGEQFGQEVALDDLDSEHMTIVGPLCIYLSQRLSHNGDAPKPAALELSNSSRRQ